MNHRAVGIRPMTRPPATDMIVRPFQEFARLEVAGGVLLAATTIVALVWANSPWRDTYTALWQTRLTVSVGDLALAKPLVKWVNDGLMAIFFFVVGMEIKREVIVGELADRRKATLPIVAALGGAVLPALIYVTLNRGGAGADGWGVPMATDIAFALAALTLLGSRIPIGLKVFLTALAIADDIGAVLVIALFYTPAVAWSFLGLAAAFLAALVLANLLGARSPVIYAVLGLGLWFAFVESGVHATVAGVLLALTVPIRSRIDADEFLRRGRALLEEFERGGEHGRAVTPTVNQRDVVHALQESCAHVETPLHRMEHALHPWVSYAILPVFALANAGVTFEGSIGDALGHPVTIGVALGLVLGKQVGVFLAAWLAVRAGVAALPTGVTWRALYGAAWLAGIGFTMSLFIAALAFDEPGLLTAAKVGILGGSVISGLGGWLVLRSVGDPSRSP
jgi:Na+:H+ antiporter, NhaA family